MQSHTDPVRLALGISRDSRSIEVKMTRREKSSNSAGFVFFDVLYEDGARSSNRKVPIAELGGLDADERAKSCIEAQDRKIAEVSGRPGGAIKSIVRSRSR
jgi:hypothetical protein